MSPCHMLNPAYLNMKTPDQAWMPGLLVIIFPSELRTYIFWALPHLNSETTLYSLMNHLE